MAVFNPGDRVRIVERAQEAADGKSQLYFPHFANLRGTVLKAYGEEASVIVDVDSLPVGIRKRHVENETAMRQRWLDGLSEEGRNRLSARDKQFGLRYSVLVGVKDLLAAPDDARDTTDLKRATESDLEAAETAFLSQRSTSAS